MPKYYFHIRDGQYLVPDEEGLSLSDWLAVKIEGHMSAWDIGRHAACTSMDCSIEISDQWGKTLDRIAVEIPHRLPC